jgi:hypothetical protein
MQQRGNRRCLEVGQRQFAPRSFDPREHIDQRRVVEISAIEANPLVEGIQVRRSECADAVTGGAIDRFEQRNAGSFAVRAGDRDDPVRGVGNSERGEHALDAPQAHIDLFRVHGLKPRQPLVERFVSSRLKHRFEWNSVGAARRQ